jgi:Zn-finger nucleic acid-binding protein
MDCPQCHQALTHYDSTEQAHVPIYLCGRCNGGFLDFTDVGEHANRNWSNLDQLDVDVAETLSDIACPKCTVEMTKVNPHEHNELVLDWCPSGDGIWLDNGELTKLRDIVINDLESRGKLAERPAGWSLAKWVLYRLGESAGNLPPGYL